MGGLGMDSGMVEENVEMRIMFTRITPLTAHFYFYENFYDAINVQSNIENVFFNI